MDMLNSDLFYNILRRLDGATLASASCTCSAFCAISKEERLWEDLCSLTWPSTKRDDVKSLISSIGGFKKFYADCFPLIINKDVLEFRWREEWMGPECYGDDGELENVSPSDFVSIVDIRYKEKTICSKVVWGIPNAGVYDGWFSDCPFRIDLFGYSASDDDDGHPGEVMLSVSDGLPPVTSIEKERKDGNLWRDLRDGIQLSWIVVNSKSRRAANLSSWHALDGQRHQPTSNDFMLHFGTVIRAKNILPYRVVKCVIGMKFRVSHVEDSGAHTRVEVKEACLQLGDMEGRHVNGGKSLMVLNKALSCDRSMNYGLVVKSCPFGSNHGLFLVPSFKSTGQGPKTKPYSQSYGFLNTTPFGSVIMGLHEYQGRHTPHQGPHQEVSIVHKFY
ncbi:hypothetical protein OSB04_020186 [Centaurea solstitialis]|uniref:F-box domain-containing protein n=1 Tax=Centaurea solstitialis TaxID=347529 RepID=A0AA38TBA3_9ASTR|nr:hypothetical protein OSB04_020186 [Centaurea solstitialis]